MEGAQESYKEWGRLPMKLGCKERVWEKVEMKRESKLSIKA